MRTLRLSTPTSPRMSTCWGHVSSACGYTELREEYKVVATAARGEDLTVVTVLEEGVEVDRLARNRGDGHTLRLNSVGHVGGRDKDRIRGLPVDGIYHIDLGRALIRVEVAQRGHGQTRPRRLDLR